MFPLEEVKVTKPRKPFTRFAAQKQNLVEENHVDENLVEEDLVDEDLVDNFLQMKHFHVLKLKML